jgi:hypothetical protein
MSHWEWNVFSPSSRFNPCLWVKVCLYKGDGKSVIIVFDMSKVQSKNIQEFVWWNFSSKVWSDSYVCICAGTLQRVINKLKQERNFTPKLLIIRGGYDNTEPFWEVFDRGARCGCQWDSNRHGICVIFGPDYSWCCQVYEVKDMAHCNVSLILPRDVLTLNLPAIVKGGAREDHNL